MRTYSVLLPPVANEMSPIVTPGLRRVGRPPSVPSRVRHRPRSITATETFSPSVVLYYPLVLQKPPRGLRINPRTSKGVQSIPTFKNAPFLLLRSFY